MPTPFERAREEGVHGHKLPRGMSFDVALAELGVEALKRLDLFLREHDLVLADRLLQPQQPVVAGLELLRVHTPRTPPELTWSPLSISSSATRWAPWVGPTPGDFASWARVCPGNHESAGKRRSARTGRGNA